MERSGLSKAIKLVLAGSLAAGLAACGGGGSGSSDTASASREGASVGTITGFGSVYVNGTHFDINNASFKNDDGLERETQLEKGMILKVQGTWGEDREGVASALHYDDTLRGPVEAGSVNWDPANSMGEFGLAGQVVKLNKRTVFKGKAPQDLTADDIVRVSGWRLSDNTFQASYVGVIGQESAGIFKTIEVEGVVTALSDSEESFTLNNHLEVSYASTSRYEDGTREDLIVGANVDIEGSFSTIGGSAVLNAQEIEFETGLFDNDDDIELSGAISASYDEQTRQFSINGIAITLNDETDLDDLSASDLVEGLQIEIEGEYRNGVVVAEEIELLEGDAEVSGKIESKEQGGEVLTVGGVRVTLNNSTLIEDDSLDDEQESLSLRVDDLSSLSVGDCLEIEGRETDDASGMIAVHVEREEAGDCDGNLELEGLVSAVAADNASITVLGVTLIPRTGMDLSTYQVDDEVEVEYVQTVGGEYQISAIEKDD
ncbi:DUF5666 domain-containing protein [Marinobacter sp. VGCF2001]|uniref:DUF5666 domain-containing protein n=1 Tax=Marinobacter sp. VGCF2001 TaxID=3417189 RepID=UPI003CEA1411